MTKNLLNLSGKIDLKTVELFKIVNQISTELGISYVVVGATARDLVLHHGFGARIRRATSDIDFGIQISSWSDFKKLTDLLINHGFKETVSAQKLISSNGTMVDIVPFGALEDEASNIQWPPNCDIVMNVQGFQEAHDNAIEVFIQKEPPITIPVVTSEGMALLKIIAWSDRERNLRVKDVGDLAYLLETYELVTEVSSRVYEEEGLMEKYDWNITLASAHLLGNDSVAIAGGATKQRIVQILNKNLQKNSPNLLVEEMCEHIEHDYQYKLSLLKAFSNGFKGEQSMKVNN